MEQKSFQEWYRDAQDASESWRTYLAMPFLRTWDQMIALAPSSASQSDLLKLKEKLLFTAFPELSLAQAVEVLEQHLLNFIVSEVGIDYDLKTRFIFVGYGNENKDRAVLREAVLRNQEVLGGKKVSEWLRKFDETFPPEGIGEVAAGKFFTQSPDIIALSKNEQAFLRRLLQVYDEWLRAPLLSGFDVAVVYNKLVELEKAGVKEINPKTFEAQYLSSPRSVRTNERLESSSRKQTSSQQIASFPLLQALSKFENLGNQLITNERIRVKSQLEPVRPSLLYWLKYYRDELGIGQHNSVERGDFLFRSENGRKLSPEERERVSLILKSIEENLPLSIDTERQEIIFPAGNTFSVTMAGRPLSQGALVENRDEMRAPSFVAQQPINQSESFRKVMQEKGIPSGAPANSWQNNPKPVQNSGGMSFSAGHIFPAEKEVIEEKAFHSVPTPSFRPAPTKKTFNDSNPFIIHPSNEEEEIS